MKRPFIVGLTGGSGSGKSRARDYFETLGISCVCIDRIKSSLLYEDHPRSMYAEMLEVFGESVLNSRGWIDQTLLRQRIKNGSEMHLWVRQNYHVAIAKEIKREFRKSKSPYCVYISTPMVERGQAPLCDRLLVIDAPLEVCRQRCIERISSSKITPQRIRRVSQILERQPPSTMRNKFADNIIVNNGSLSEFYSKIDKVHKLYLSQCKA